MVTPLGLLRNIWKKARWDLHKDYKKITSYPQYGCVSGCKEAESRGRRQDRRDLSMWLGTERSRSHFGTVRWAGMTRISTARRREVTRVGRMRDMAKESLLADHPILQTEPRRQFWALQNQTFTALLKQS